LFINAEIEISKIQTFLMPYDLSVTAWHEVPQATFEYPDSGDDLQLPKVRILQ